MRSPAGVTPRTVAWGLALAGQIVVPGPCTPQSRTFPDARPGAGVSWLVVGASALALAVSLPLDAPLRTWSQDPRRQASDGLAVATDVLTPFGAQLPWVGGVVLYGVARAYHRPVLADGVLHTGEGMIAASVVTGLLKVTVHRARPYVPPHDPATFLHGPLLSPKSSRMSFPSGHATLAFALATGVTAEVGRRWPEHARLTGVALYTIAVGVAFSRVYDDRHWTSDVVAGAAVGTLVSRAMMRRVHPAGPDPARGASARLLVVPGPVPMVGLRMPLGRGG